LANLASSAFVPRSPCSCCPRRTTGRRERRSPRLGDTGAEAAALARSSGIALLGKPVDAGTLEAALARLVTAI